MYDQVRLFPRIKTYLAASTILTHIEVVEDIKSGKYKDEILKLRPLYTAKQAVKAEHGDPSPPYQAAYEKYKKQKGKLPWPMFSGVTAEGTGISNPDCDTKRGFKPTGICVADIDGLSLEQIASLRGQVEADPCALWCFLSPSGAGLKIGYQAPDITNDTDHKKFYASLENYYAQEYGLETDVTCKDIRRACYVSYDPDAYINKDPQLFDVDKWAPKAIQPVPTQVLAEALNFQHEPTDKEHLDNLQILARGKLSKALQSFGPAGHGQHNRIRNASITIGAYFNYMNLTKEEVCSQMEAAVTGSGSQDLTDGFNAIRDGFNYGFERPEVPGKAPRVQRPEVGALREVPTTAQLLPALLAQGMTGSAAMKSATETIREIRESNREVKAEMAEHKKVAKQVAVLKNKAIIQKTITGLKILDSPDGKTVHRLVLSDGRTVDMDINTFRNCYPALTKISEVTHTFYDTVPIPVWTSIINELSDNAEYGQVPIEETPMGMVEEVVSDMLLHWDEQYGDGVIDVENRAPLLQHECLVEDGVMKTTLRAVRESLGLKGTVINPQDTAEYLRNLDFEVLEQQQVGRFRMNLWTIPMGGEE